MSLRSESTAELSAALAKAQSSMRAAAFNRINPHFKSKYADLASVLDAIRKPLADNGLSTTQVTEIRDGQFLLVTTLWHASGQWLASEYPLPLGAKPQELGSALTYARRYSLSALVCIASEEDDDANAASKSGNGQHVTAEQVEKLIGMVNEVGADLAAYCKHLGVDGLPELPASRYAEAVAQLDAKRKANLKRAAA
jgi:hypothetical protein